MRLTLTAAIVLLLAASGPARAAEATRAATPQGGRAAAPGKQAGQMGALARALIPARARASVSSTELAVRSCGIAPTYPCISTFFTLPSPTGVEALRALLRAQAVRNGWRVVRLAAFGTGLALELTRGPFHARYVLERQSGPASAIIGLDLYGPADPPAGPSASERRRWSADKRRYIGRADSICAHTVGHISHASDLASAVASALTQLQALRPPHGESSRVQAILRPLRNLAAAIRAANQANEEDAAAAAIATAEYAKRFDKAAARYGLTRCVIG
jgi:hypothetical protein